jgi:ubiquinone/menaquinone biosynthesis C-methylase UbiE
MWKQRRVTNLVRHVLDEWFPPVLRDSRPLNWALARAFHGKHFNLDFKRQAPTMTAEEFAAAYSTAAQSSKNRYRQTDMTAAEIDWVLDHVDGSEILEVSCGHGVLSRRLAEQSGLQVTATEFSEASVERARQYFAETGANVNLVMGTLDRLPFEDESFDTTVCAHTLEHVIDFERSIQELIRVTRRRLLVIVPCQRYYRYTIDYHLHFFPDPAQLQLRIGIPGAECHQLTGDLCYLANLAPSARCQTPLSGPPVGWEELSVVGAE